MLIASPATREAARLLTPGGTVTFLRGASHSIAAAGASAVLVMGFPVLLKATSGDLGSTGGVVILAVTLTRAPLMVPLTAMQGNLIAHFVDQRAHRLRALVAPAAVVAGLGVVFVLIAGLLGPWLMRAAFGADYHVDGALLAWLTAAAITIALLTLTGAAAVAAALHRSYSLGWVGATVASILLLLLPLDLETRTVVALLFGPLVGIAVHLAALARVGLIAGAAPARDIGARVVCGASTPATTTFGSSSRPSTRRALSATSSPTFARSSDTWSALTTAAATTPASAPCGRAHTWCAIPSTSARARRSRPASSTRALSRAPRCSLPSTPTASTG